jgi:hypothetical protein
MLAAIRWEANRELNVTVDLGSGDVLLADTVEGKTPLLRIITPESRRPKLSGISQEGFAKCSTWPQQISLKFAVMLRMHPAIQTVALTLDEDACANKEVDLGLTGLVTGLSDVLGLPWDDVYKAAQEAGYTGGSMAAFVRSL